MLLVKLKETSESALKKPVADCVISVSWYYDIKISLTAFYITGNCIESCCCITLLPRILIVYFPEVSDVCRYMSNSFSVIQLTDICKIFWERNIKLMVGLLSLLNSLLIRKLKGGTIAQWWTRCIAWERSQIQSQTYPGKKGKKQKIWENVAQNCCLSM